MQDVCTCAGALPTRAEDISHTTRGAVAVQNPYATRTLRGSIETRATLPDNTHFGGGTTCRSHSTNNAIVIIRD